MYCWLAMVVGLCFQGVGFRNEFGGGYSVIVYVIVHLCKFGAQQPHICWTSRVWQGRQKKRHDNWKIWRKNRDPKISEGYEHESKPITTQYDVVKLVLYDHQTSGRWGLHRNPHATASYNPFPGFFWGDESSWGGKNMNRGWDYTKNTSTIINHLGCFSLLIQHLYNPKEVTQTAYCLCWSTAWSQVALPIPTCHSTIENIEFGCGVETDAKWTHEW